MANNIPVFYEGQDDLIDLLATSMCSMCYNTKSFIDFYILDCGIHEFNKKQLESLKEKFNNFSIKYIPIDLKQFKGLKGWGESGLFVDCYSRLLIPEIVPELDKAIYLDADVIALRDIKLLWVENLDGYDFGAAPETGYGPYIRNNCIKNLHVSDKNIYPNTGVLLIDCKKWREKQVSKNLLNIAKEYKDKLLILNEDILSIAYNNIGYRKLDNRFNSADRLNETQQFFPELNDDYITNEWKNVVIQHLTPFKPWKYCNNTYNSRTLKFFDDFWFFAKMTPFYEGMLNRYNYNINLFLSNFIINNCYGFRQNYSSYWIKLLNFIPFLKIKNENNKKVYKLFGFLPIFSIKNK